MRALGLAMLAVCVLHGSVHVRNQRPWELLWSCNVATLLVGIGLLTRSAACVAVGTLWLCTGLPLWLLYLAGGGEFMPTSLLTHLGGLSAGLAGVRTMGAPAAIWWKAAGALLLLIALCRLATPAEANVNLAFSVYRGWEGVFPSHPLYLGFLVVLHAAAFFLLERLVTV